MNEIKKEKKKRKQKELKRGTLSLVLLSISLIIFGVIGLIVLTQMEMVNGWQYSTYDNVDLHILEYEDVNDDDINEIVVYGGCKYEPDKEDSRSFIDDPRYGVVALLDGRDGTIIWEREFNNPILSVFRIGDVDDDKKDDLMVCRSRVDDKWGDKEGDHRMVDFEHNDFETELLSGGEEGEQIDIESPDNSFTNFYVKQVIDLGNYDDHKEDLITLQYNATESQGDDYDYDAHVKSYYINGTLSREVHFKSSGANDYFDDPVPDIELFEYNGEDHLLAIGSTNITLVNLTAPDFTNMIYSEPIGDHMETYIVIKDLNDDDVDEIILANKEGDAALIDGATGTVLEEKGIEESLHNIGLQEIGNDEDDATYIIIDSSEENEGDTSEDFIVTTVYKIKEDKFSKVWEEESRPGEKSVVLNDDLDGDDINDVMLHESIDTAASPNQVDRYTIVSGIDNEVELGELNIDQEFDRYLIVSDTNNDGVDDIVYGGHSDVGGLAAMDPVPLYRSPLVPYGLPMLILCICMLAFGLLILILKGKQLHFSFRKSAKTNKMSMAVIIITLILITATFALFFGLLNIFNSTLVQGNEMTEIVLAFILVMICWYGMLPLTAAVYHHFSPRFGYLFVRLRVLFFKITRTTNHEIIVSDLGDRTELGNVNRIKRVILPLMLSMAIGFYSYTTLAPIFGYPFNFTSFGGEDFFDFMVGYNLLCTLPMIFTFIIFSPLIAGNYLLDDTGIVYFSQSKKHRKPGDIEPISIWSQSLIKGIAGITAVLNFVEFFLLVDFSGFFTQNMMMSIFGVLVIMTMFWGLPFLTAFTYMFLANDVMDFKYEENKAKLLKIMEKNGYDITPRNILNLYPDGRYVASEKMTKSIPDNVIPKEEIKE